MSDSICAMCLRASDIGVYTVGDPIAYAHPGCPDHGRCTEFVLGPRVDNAGRPLCGHCLAYEDEHHWNEEGQ